MLTFKQLKYALAVAEHRNFRRAAEACGVSQSRISAAISDLESDLDAALFERDNRKVFVTTLGEQILKQAKQIHLAVDELYDVVRHSTEPMSAPIRLGLIPTIAPYLLPRVLPKLREVFPDLSLILEEATSAELTDRVRAGYLDTAILALPYPLQGLHAFNFYEENFHAVFGKKALVDPKKKLTTERLAAHTLFLLQDGHCLKDHALQVCQFKDREADIQTTGTSLTTLIQMALSGMGTTLIPDLAVEQIKTQSTEAQIIPLAEKGPHRTLAFITRLNYPRVPDILKLRDLFNEILHQKTA